MGAAVVSALLGVPGVAAAQTQPARVVPAAVSAGAMLVRVEINSYRAYMQVDTGATTSVIDSRSASAAGLVRNGEPVKGRTIGCTVKSQPVAATKMLIGSVPVPDTTIVSMRQPGRVPTHKGLPVIGLLGNDLLSGFGSVGVDFADHRLVLGGTTPETGRELDSDVLRDTQTGQVVLFGAKVAFDRRSAVFAVDTGAAFSVVDSAVVKRLGLPTVKRRLKVVTPGCTTKVRPVIVRRWKSGVRLPTDLGVSRNTGLRKIGLSGLIGASVLQSFGQATFDYTSGRIVLGYPVPAGSEPAPAPPATRSARQRTPRAYRL